MLVIIAILSFLYAPLMFFLRNPPAKEENVVGFFKFIKSFLRAIFYYFSFKSRLSTSLEDQIFDMFHIRTINQVIQSAKTMRTFKLSSLLLIKMDIYQIFLSKLVESRENKLVFGFSITFYYSFYFLCCYCVLFYFFIRSQ